MAEVSSWKALNRRPHDDANANENVNSEKTPGLTLSKRADQESEHVQIFPCFQKTLVFTEVATRFPIEVTVGNLHGQLCLAFVNLSSSIQIASGSKCSLSRGSLGGQR